jgi:outer membrane lipoprotein-sorting protein
MKYVSSILFTALLLCASFAVIHAGIPGELTLEDIFSKANSIRYLSYQTKVTSPAGSVRKYKIWIHEDNVYVAGQFEKMKIIGQKSYLFYNDDWLESPGLSINTVLRFLKQAQTAEDTKLVGQETLDSNPTTILEYTQPRPAWGSEIKIRLWISHKNFIPMRVKANNLNQKKIQTEEITNISFNENDYKAFFREMEEYKERRRRAKEKPTPWHPEKEAAYLKMLEIDQQDNLAAKQKCDAWEGFLKSISEKDPSTRRDDQMRYKAQIRIDYWKYIGRFSFSPSGIVKDIETALEWVVGPDRDTNWEEARSWANGLEIDGGGWRLPTMEELKSVYKKGLYGRYPPPFYKNSGWYIWSGENRNQLGSFYFHHTIWQKRSNSNIVSKNMRAAAVRGQN